MRKRKDDIINAKSIHMISIIGIICFIFVIFSLETTPKIFSSMDNRLTANINTKFDKNFLDNQILKIIKYKKPDFSSLNNIEVEAKSFIVYDINKSQILASKNENTVLPLASLTKVVTAITAIDIAGRDKDIIIKKSFMRKDETLDLGLIEGQKWKLDELLRYGLTISSNSSMDIIASTISDSNQEFVYAMNNYTKKLGYKNFVFNSASGLDYEYEIGGKGTALEYAKLFVEAYSLIPDIMSYTTNSKINLNSNEQKIYQIKNTNKEAGNTVGILASKTGFTDAAGGNLAIIFNEDINNRIVIIVLGSTADGRFKDVNKLYKMTKNILEKN